MDLDVIDGVLSDALVRFERLLMVWPSWRKMKSFQGCL
jgi:hypothetical protein